MRHRIAWTVTPGPRIRAASDTRPRAVTIAAALLIGICNTLLELGTTTTLGNVLTLLLFFANTGVALRLGVRAKAPARLASA